MTSTRTCRSGASVFAERLNVDLTSAVDTGTAINATAQRTAAARVLAAGGTAAQAAAASQAAARQAAQLGFSPGTADGYLRIKGDEVSVGYTLGMTVTPVEGTNIAFSYRSKVEHKITDGKADFTIPQNAAAFLATAAPVPSSTATVARPSPCRPAPPWASPTA